MTPARFRWGMLFVLAGVLLLMRNFGVIDWDSGLDLVLSIPILLIAIGIEKIFTRSRLEVISYLTTLALFAGGIYVAYEAAQRPSLADSYSDRIKIEPSINAVHAVLNFDGGALEVRDSKKNQLYYRIREWVPKPKIRTSVDDGVLKVSFDNRKRIFWGGHGRLEWGESDDWKFAFAREVPLWLECNGDESEIYLNLATTPLRDLVVNADDARVTVRVGKLEPLVHIRLRGDESILKLRIPFESGLRIVGLDRESNLSRMGLERVDGSFVNQGYDSFDSKIEVDLDDQHSSLSIVFY